LAIAIGFYLVKMKACTKNLIGNGSALLHVLAFAALLVTSMFWGQQPASAQTQSCTIAQITDTTGDNVPAYSVPALISADGTHIVFLSSANIVDNENPDLNNELFLYDVNTHTSKQITHTVAPVVVHQQFSITLDGRRVAFSSTSTSIMAIPIMPFNYSFTMMPQPTSLK
jgi:Tol biopolymer transport system component